MKTNNTMFIKIINTLSIICTVTSTLFFCSRWTQLPNQIPMHFDMAGNITRYGNKMEMILLPIFMWIAFLLISIIQHFPQTWNTAVNITEDNQVWVYQTTKAFLVSIKLSICILFSIITYMLSMQTSPPNWFMPFSLVIFLILIIGFCIRLYKVK